jgi:uncharacterized protein (DUF3820 family)
MGSVVKSFTDQHVMSFGLHSGKKLANVPADYLLYAYHNFKYMPEGLKLYIEDNMEDLKSEAKKNNPKKFKESRLDY